MTNYASSTEDSVWLLKTPRVSLLREQGACTCHSPQMPVQRATSKYEWMHLNTGMWATTYHVHQDSSASDCDGRMDRSSVLKMTDYYEHVGVKTEDDLWKKAVEHSVFVHGYSVSIKITNPQYESSALSGGQTCDVSEDTDEGYRAVSLRSCTDPWCADDRPTQRDYAAEAMGY